MISKEIRAKFFDFFQEKAHKIVPSAPMVMRDDPTLMFTNAGMNQFKEYFLGLSQAAEPRVADTQKCLRVSGKHNDLEEVGKDAYHHTMFEMLGNWSFGDYFKEEAIAWAWELLTGVYGIEKENLYVTVFEGSDDADQLERDEEAFNLWKKILPESRILMGNKKDNFWEMGDQGPCGPCSEIHVDIRAESEKEKTPGADLVNKDHPEVIELWNLVFIQYNRKANGKLEELPDKHIDTGMGFERLCMVLQGKNSSYDTDLFLPLIDRVQTLSKKKYDASEEISMAMRVIVDHLRAVSFAIADGQLPGNTGAGYVIRRILRRAIRYGFTFLELKDPFIHKLVETLSKTMGEAYPELKEQRQLIENVIREEEHSFLKTLDQGLVLLENVIGNTDGQVISGEKAFELYDTFGFPKDLTALILEERGLSLDEATFNAALEAQKSRSRAASEVSKEDWVILEKDNTQEFIGYELLEADVSLVKYRKLRSQKEGDQYQLVFNRTPFYAEGGGQVGDKGYLEGPGGDVVYIVDTKKENNETVHFAKSLPKDPNAGLKAVVDKKQRQRTARNHSATHLLHQALRHVLGDHVEQKGSAVHSKYLRFDFSHFSKLSADELRKVERFVNERISEGIPLLENRNVPMQQALEDGAMALFGEKYGDAVRTIRFGDSIELCGGTHVFNTADIWYFKIRSEGAIAAGVRRIEAITSDAAREYFLDKQNQLAEIQSLFKGAKDPLSAVTQLQDENAGLKKELEKLQKAQAGNLKSELMDKLEDHNGIHVLAEKVDLPANAIKDLLFQMGSERQDLFILLASDTNGKAMLSCFISKPLVKAHSLDAGTIVRELGKHIQGSGGGQAFFATAGGKDPSGISAALAAFKDYLP